MRYQRKILFAALATVALSAVVVLFYRQRITRMETELQQYDERIWFLERENHRNRYSYSSDRQDYEPDELTISSGPSYSRFNYDAILSEDADAVYNAALKIHSEFADGIIEDREKSQLEQRLQQLERTQRELQDDLGY